MTVLHHRLFNFPIHHYTYEKYYQRHDQYVESQKQRTSEQWGQPFEKLGRDMQRLLLHEEWWWPPWKFNDTVGFLDLGMDQGNCMTANLYFQRKHFPRGSREKRRGTTTLLRRQYLYYQEVPKIAVIDQSSNEAYLAALKIVIKRAKQMIRARNRTFKLWLPPFDFSCIKFVQAHAQARDRGAR